MKTLACFAAILLASTAPATTLTVAPRSTVFMNGSSNVARWRCSGSTLSGSMEVATPLEQINHLIDRIEDGQIGEMLAHPDLATIPQPQFELTIPIEALRCSGGRPMERDLVAALSAIRYPSIRIHFRELRGGVEHDIDARTYRMTVVTDISLAGSTRAVDTVVTAERVSKEAFRITAAVPLKMTDFGIQPPRALFGMIRAADQLTVSLTLVLEARPHA